jgi:hypothetical protein
MPYFSFRFFRNEHHGPRGSFAFGLFAGAGVFLRAMRPLEKVLFSRRVKLTLREAAGKEGEAFAD